MNDEVIAISYVHCVQCVSDFDLISSDATGADPVLLHGPDFPDYRLIMILVLMRMTNCDKIKLVTKWIQSNNQMDPTMNQRMLGMDLPVSSCSSTTPALRARGTPLQNIFNQVFNQIFTKF